MVHAQHASSSILYEANRDHLARPAVETVAGMRRTLVRHPGEMTDTVPSAGGVRSVPSWI